MLLWSGLSQMALLLPQDSDFGLTPVWKVSSWIYLKIRIIEQLHWIDTMLGTDVVTVGQKNGPYLLGPYSLVWRQTLS